MKTILVVSILVFCVYANAFGMTQAVEERRAHIQPTRLEDVLRSTQRHYPAILAAQAQWRSQQAQVLAAQGAFDARLESTLHGRLSGFYSGQFIDTELIHPLPIMNAKVFAGYRISDGGFPVYEDEWITNSRGEARIGFVLSLLRDRTIDTNRFNINASLLENEAELQRLRARQITAQKQAYIAYAQWYLAAKLTIAYEELMTIAVERGEALQRSVASGNSAEILLLENEQALLQRRGMVIEARRRLATTAEQLSLFLRDNNGQPLIPQFSQELIMPEVDQELLEIPFSTLFEQTLPRRPEITIARLAMQQAGLEKKLAQNLARPRLDLSFYTARDFGSGSITREGVDNTINLNFSLPLRTREARGKAAAAQAKADGLRQDIQLLREQAQADLRIGLINLQTTQNMEHVADEELSVARALAEAEARRFNSGLSDFFLVNVRERTMAEAQVKRWRAHLAHHIALANFYVASMNRPALGLDP